MSLLDAQVLCPMDLKLQNPVRTMRPLASQRAPTSVLIWTSSSCKPSGVWTHCPTSPGPVSKLDFFEMTPIAKAKAGRR